MVNVLLAFMLDLFAHQMFSGWYSYFLIVAVLQCLIVEPEYRFNPFNVIWLTVGLTALAGLDVLKYGRCGVSWGILLIVCNLFFILRYYCLSGNKTVLAGLVFCIALIDMAFIRPYLLGLHANWAMTGSDLCGTLATITLAFLGARGNRFWLFVKDNQKRKVWTPNRKSAL